MKKKDRKRLRKQSRDSAIYDGFIVLAIIIGIIAILIPSSIIGIIAKWVVICMASLLVLSMIVFGLSDWFKAISGKNETYGLD